MKRLDELGVSPAPWKCAAFYDDPTSNGRDILDATGSALGNTQPTHSQSIADARLIAAAPDLYEALRKIVSNNECGLMCNLCAVTDRCEIYPGVKALEKAGGAK